PPPPGCVVDLDNPQRRGQDLITWIGIVGLFIATVLLIVRMYTKAVLAKKINSDDWCLLFAWKSSSLSSNLTDYLYLKFVQIFSVPVQCLIICKRSLIHSLLLYSPALAFAKISFLCSYLNLNPAQGFHTSVYLTMFVVIGSCVGIVISLLAACTPFARNTDVTVTEGQCLDKAALYIATGVLNIITDIMVLVLPIPIILQLQMVRSRKIMLILLFSVGSITCITSAVRVALLPPMLTSKDSSWYTVYPSLWILIEASLIIITGTLPTMRLFLRHVAPTLIGESEATHASTKRHETGWELQHREMHDPYDLEDGSSEREIFPAKRESS
ncbi:hypothetical protein EJ07DRAFT_105666, partial [Lizonia empirigonia]